MALVECKLSRVVMSEVHDHHIIVLQEKEGERKFPIIVGFFEVHAIHRTINSEPPPRPLTHELLGTVLKELGVTVDRVVVNDLREGTFYARLLLKQDGKEFDMDSRPSDAIALAVQAQAPIFVDERVLERAARDSI